MDNRESFGQVALLGAAAEFGSDLLAAAKAAQLSKGAWRPGRPGRRIATLHSRTWRIGPRPAAKPSHAAGFAGLEQLEPRTYMTATIGISNPDVPIDLGGGAISWPWVDASPAPDLRATINTRRSSIPAEIVSGNGARMRLAVDVKNIGDGVWFTSGGVNINSEDDVPVDSGVKISVDVKARRLSDGMLFDVATLTNQNISGLKVGAKKTLTLNFTLPPGIPDGTYVLQVNIDSADVVNELRANNNDAETPDDPGIHITQGVVDIITTIAATKLDTAFIAGEGGKGTVRVNLTNHGNFTLPRNLGGSVEIVLVDDQMNETVIGAAAAKVGGAKVDAVRKTNVKVTIPTDAQNGDYTLVARFVPGIGVTDVESANDTETGQMVTIADPFVELTPWINDTRTKFVAGIASSDVTPITLAVNVTNDGNVATSRTQTIDVTVTARRLTDGMVVEVQAFEHLRFSGVRAGATKTLRLRTALPPGVEAGNWVLEVQIDSSDHVAEG